MGIGELIALEAYVPHDLKANQRPVIRLILSKKNSILRVDKVAA